LLFGKQDASGLLYRRARYLDPATGHFVSEDPIGLAGGMNLYGFANGDPVNFSDPFGLCRVRVGWTATPVKLGTRHAFIEVTRPDNTQVIYRGGPGQLNLRAIGENIAAGATATDEQQSIEGNVTAIVQRPADKKYDARSALSFDSPLVDDDASCDNYEQSFDKSETLINKAKIPYGAQQNSNSTANTLLIRAGLGWLQTGGRFAPGAGSLLVPPY
jgi:RHS repeat-associated protein